MATGSQNHVLQRLRGVLVQQGTASLSDGDLLTRYVKQRDAAAFEALVRRHGPMVLGVCRRVLANPHDAEDAFQATFLVLLRKASSLRSPSALGNWLYGVAYRTSLEARTRAARRRAKEAAVTPRSTTPEDTWAEVRQVLDEELERLPLHYRTVLVLCDLEGKTRKEAAEQLGCPEGTVAGRLARARTKLASRLTRRGVTLSGGVLAALLARHAVACVPSTMVAAAVALTNLTTIPIPVAGLAEGVLKGMLVHKLRAGTALLLAVGLLVAGVSLAAQRVSVKAGPAAAASVDDGPGKTAEPKGVRTDGLGDPLPAEALVRLGTVRFRHSGYITSLAFTPDGKQLVSHGYDGVRVWDAATGREINQVIPKPKGWINEALLTPDGKSVVTVESDSDGKSAICVRSRDELTMTRQFAIEYLQTMRLSPNGQLLAGITNQSKGIEIYDLKEGKKSHSWPLPDGWIWACEFSGDGRSLITGSSDGAVRFWDVATGEKRNEIAVSRNVVGKLALSGDGKYLATLSMTEVKTNSGSYFPWDNLIRIRDAASGKELRQLTMPARPGFNKELQGFTQMLFAPDGKTLATVGQDSLLRFWDVATGAELRRVPLDSWGVMTLAFSRDGKTLAVGTNSIRLLDVAAGKDLVPLPAHIGNVAASADGRTIVTANGKGTVVFWDGTTGRERRRLAISDQPISMLHLAPDGRKFLTTDTFDKVGHVWDTASGKELRRLDGSDLAPWPLAIAADGRTAAFAGQEKTVVLFDLDTGKEMGRFGKHDEAVNGAAFHPDGRTLLVWCADHTAHVWDRLTKRELRQFEFADAPPGMPGRPALVGGRGRVDWAYAAAASPDGRLVAYGSQSPYLALHEVATGQVIQLLTPLPDGVSVVAFSPDSRMLAWGGWREPAIHLVEVATGKERRQFVGHKGRVTFLEFAADGKTLISGGEDTTALVWDLTGKLGEPDGHKPPTAAELDACWASLADADGVKAYQALRRLAASPTEAIPYLGKKLAAGPRVDEKQIAKLIADLDSDTFAVRESAFKELERLGEAAAAGIRKTLAGTSSAEVRRRLEPLLEAQAQSWRTPSADQVRLLRAVEVLEQAGTPEAQQLLRKLTEGAPEARLTREAKGSLERLNVRTSGSR